MQIEILIAAVSIIVTFIIATWRWSASQNRRFDQMMKVVQNEVGKLRDDNNQQISKLRDDNNQQISKLRDDNNQQISKLRDDNNRLRSEVRDDIKEVRNDIKEVREDVHRLDNRIAHQECMIRALWAETFKGDPTSEPASEPAFPQ